MRTAQPNGAAPRFATGHLSDPNGTSIALRGELQARRRRDRGSPLSAAVPWSGFGMAFDPVSGKPWVRENGNDALDEPILQRNRCLQTAT
jgi:adenosine/AMP kinase